MSLSKLKEIVLDRIPVDIFLAHEALGVYMAIAEDSDFLNRSCHHHVFGIIQRQALGAFIISLCSLFEKPSQRYPNYSIRSALTVFSTIFEGFVVPGESEANLEEYICAEIDPNFRAHDPLMAAKAAQMVCDHFEDQCPRTPPREGNKLDTVLDALKVLRDKRIAHHEDHELNGLSVTDLESAIELLCFAQTFVNIVGYGLLAFSVQSTAQPEQFAQERSESGREMKKMIQALLNAEQHNAIQS